ncbi:hypothetical protein AWC19_26995 [Mycobacterium palustre]|uniref:Uncharacterized protein n=1 Tax=Mycobacterium palustre TaxID=153971 RepID=A0A1X1ZWJ3_9MYCO|nr:hypothetical protein AWC19_26995 [Mycobacterium palustre]
MAHLLDAVEDYRDDVSRGKGNPLTATGTPVGAARGWCDDAALGIELALTDVEFTDGRLAHQLLTGEVRAAITCTFARAGYPAGNPGAEPAAEGEAPNPKRKKDRDGCWWCCDGFDGDCCDWP